MFRYRQRKFSSTTGTTTPLMCLRARALQSHGVARSGKVRANLGRRARLTVTAARLFCSPPVRFHRSVLLASSLLATCEDIHTQAARHKYLIKKCDVTRDHNSACVLPFFSKVDSLRLCLSSWPKLLLLSGKTKVTHNANLQPHLSKSCLSVVTPC